MLITPIKNTFHNKNYNYKNQISFVGSKTPKDNSTAYSNEIVSSTVNQFFTNNRQFFIEKYSSAALNDFKTTVEQELKNYTKTNDFNARINLLLKLADFYKDVDVPSWYGSHPKEQRGDFEKVGAITAHVINLIYDNPNITSTEKHSLITSDRVLGNIKYLLSTKNNGEVWSYVMHTLNKTGYKEFLPFAEQVCDNRYLEPDYPELLRDARLLINKHYNLRNLSSFASMNSYYQRGAIQLIARWGLPEHADMLRGYLNSSNEDIIKHAIVALGAIGAKEDTDRIKIIGSQNTNRMDSLAIALAKLHYPNNLQQAFSLVNFKNVVKTPIYSAMGKSHNPTYLNFLRQQYELHKTPPRFEFDHKESIKKALIELGGEKEFDYLAVSPSERDEITNKKAFSLESPDYIYNFYDEKKLRETYEYHRPATGLFKGNDYSDISGYHFHAAAMGVMGKTADDANKFTFDSYNKQKSYVRMHNKNHGSLAFAKIFIRGGLVWKS